MSLLFIWISCLLPSAPAADIRCTAWSCCFTVYSHTCCCTVHSLLLLLYNAESAPATVQCTVSSCFCTVQSALATVQCTVHSLVLLLYSAQSAPATAQSTVCSYCFTVYSLLLLLYIAQPTPATVQLTVYYCCCTLRTIRRDFTGIVFFWYLISYILCRLYIVFLLFMHIQHTSYPAFF